MQLYPWRIFPCSLTKTGAKERRRLARYQLLLIHVLGLLVVLRFWIGRGWSAGLQQRWGILTSKECTPFVQCSWRFSDRVDFKSPCKHLWGSARG